MFLHEGFIGVYTSIGNLIALTMYISYFSMASIIDQLHKSFHIPVLI